MRVLVTGATGFLGSSLVPRLIAEGLDVAIIKRKNSRFDELEGLKIEQLIGDVTELDSLIRAIRDVDTVFHLAGLIAYSKAQRPAMEAVNVQGTANVIEACKRNGVRKLVYLSSVVAIGASFDGTPLNEESAYNVGHLNLGYFETKHEAENLVKEAVKKGDLDAVMINPSTIYGAGDAKKGSRGVQLKVARGKFPFYTSGGVSIVAVEDVIDCIMKVWRIGRPGERYIVSGENLLIRDAFRIIADEAGVEPPKIYLPDPVVKVIGRVGDLMEASGKKGPLNTENAWTSILYHWFDSSKARRELGLNPRPAREAIANSIRWSKEHGLI